MKDKAGDNQNISRSEQTFSFLRLMVFGLFFIVFSWIYYMVLWSGTDRYSPFVIPLALVLAAGLFFARPVIRALVFRLPYRKCIFVGSILAAAGFAGMLLIAFALRNDVNDNWDYGLVFSTASRLAAGKGSGRLLPYETDYYANYGNNALFLRILTGVLRLVVLVTGNQDVYFLLDCSIVVNCILILTAILACTFCITSLRSVQQGLLGEIILLLMSPFYLYAAFTYTDVYGLLPSAFTLFFLVKAMLKRHELRRFVCLALAAVSASVGFMIKGTVIIYLLAAFAAICLAKEFSPIRLRGLVIYIAAAALSIVLITLTNHMFLDRLGVTAELREEKAVPAAHFLMMAMNPATSGQYNNADVAFTNSFPGKKAKQEADIRELKRRIGEMGFAGVLNHVFIKKAMYIYGTGTAGAPSYITRKPLSENGAVRFFGTNTVCFEIMLLYKAMLEGLVLAMSGAALWKRRDEDGYVLFMKICLTGMFFFFCLWEVHPRYTLLFLPLVGLLAAEYLLRKDP